MASPSESAVRILAHAERREPTLGAGRLVCVDGLAGSGKTTIAGEIRRLRPDAVVIGTDEMLEGWGGLPTLGTAVDALLRPLAAGRPGRWRRWDWTTGGWDGWRAVAPLGPGGLLVLEGVGSAAASYDELVTTLAWVEAPADVRRERWRLREGDLDHWAAWADAEAAVHARERTRERADLLVATGGTGRNA